MNEQIKNKLAEVIGWERRKRRERIGAAAACAALALALVLTPLNGFLPIGWWRWLVPLALFVALAPVLLYRRRWRRRDETRVAVSLDHTLALDERAVTGWELAQRSASSPAAQLVYKEVEASLRSVDPRTLFPRRWGWPAYLALPLLVLWFSFLWFDLDHDGASAGRRPTPSLAQKAREFAHEFQERAREQGLNESLKLGQELETVARAGIENETPDESFRNDLAGMRQKFSDAAKSAGEKESFSATESRQSLEDLQAELGAARDLAQLPDLPKGAEQFGRRWLDRLATFPQLKRHLDQADGAGQGQGRNELKSFLNRLERQVTGELDRRALLDAQQYLQQMMKQKQGQQSEHLVRSGGDGEEDPAADGVKEKGHGSRPGKEPGAGAKEPPSPLPHFRADATSRVEGALGAGESRSFMFKGNPTSGKATVPQQDVVASYRRQAEQELNSERVPEALKETIKNYFLSLGEGSR